MGRRESCGLSSPETFGECRYVRDLWWARNVFKHWGAGSHTAPSPLTKCVYELPVGCRALLVHDEAHGSPTLVIPLPRDFEAGGLLTAQDYLDNVVVVGQLVFVAAVRRSDHQYTAILCLAPSSSQPHLVCVIDEAGYHFDVFGRSDGTLRVLICAVHLDGTNGHRESNLESHIRLLDVSGPELSSIQTLRMDPLWGRCKPKFITPNRLLLTESIARPSSPLGWERELWLLDIAAGAIRKETSTRWPSPHPYEWYEVSPSGTFLLGSKGGLIRVLYK